MTRTTVDVDDRALDAAHSELGTKGLSETTRRRALRGFDVRRDIDGTPEEVREGRDYERVASVTDLQHLWMVSDGSLA